MAVSNNKTKSKSGKAPKGISSSLGKSSRSRLKDSIDRFIDRLSSGDFIEMLKAEKAHFICGLVLLILSVYLCIMLISFLFTGAADQSQVEGIRLGQIGQAEHIRNWAGALGAWLSNIIMNHWFGVSSLLLAVYALLLSLRLMRVRIVSLGKTFIYCIFLFIWLSVFFGFICSGNSSLNFLGGAHGYHVSQWMQGIAGTPGVILVLLVTMLIFLVFAFKNTMKVIRKLFVWSNFQNSLKEKIGHIGEGISDVLDDDEEEEEEESEKAEDTNSAVTFTFEKGQDDIYASTQDEEETPSDRPETGSDGLPFEDPKADSPKTDSAAAAADGIEMTVVLAQGDENKPAEEEDDDLSGETDMTKVAARLVAKYGEFDPKATLSHFKNPPVQLLKDYGDQQNAVINPEEQMENKNRIIEVLGNFGIGISSIQATIGPTVTLYEIVPEAGIRISRIKSLESDIALSLAAEGIRIIAPIPGKGTIGIEVPSRNPKMVPMRTLLQSRKFEETKYDLPVALGKTITNEVFMFDLCKMPHLLVAGATGQGKSVGLNAIITSLLYKKHPGELKLVMVDPKMVEFSMYKDILNHYLAKYPDDSCEPIITESDKVIQTLQSLTIEMDERYRLLSAARCRNVKEYNDKFKKRLLNPEQGHKYMPYIVIVIDEFGDLIMTAGREIEMPIARIAQKARAVGMHMVIATQRPTTNIITGTIKANFPARLAFKVASQIDSRTILDSTGANQLIGKGDCLFLSGSDAVRVQCAFIDTPEVEDVVRYISQQQGYPRPFELPEVLNSEGGGEVNAGNLSGALDPLFEEAARMVVNEQQGSTSNIQRKFAIGYNRAGRIMDQLEAAGIVGPAQGSKPRQVLVDSEAQLDMRIGK